VGRGWNVTMANGSTLTVGVLARIRLAHDVTNNSSCRPAAHLMEVSKVAQAQSTIRCRD